MNRAEITAREACARELEWMGRGEAAYDHSSLIEIAKGVRLLPPAKTPAGMILAVARHVLMEKSARAVSQAPCLDRAITRVLEIDPDDPMKPFSDAANWWPRSEKPGSGGDRFGEDSVFARRSEDA